MVKSDIKIVERCRISPPEGSVPPTHVTLSFFDIRWIFFFPMLLFFFDLPRPTDYFTLAVVPRLKRSLSLSLRRFFPLAADLVIPPPPHKPYLRFSGGAAAVSFTVAESGADFGGLVSGEPRDAAECRHLVPELHGGDGGAYPLLALQVTVFPGRGFSVGATFNHAAADWRAFLHFMKSWAFICGSELTPVEHEPPRHDRGAIVDRFGIEPVFLKNLWARRMADTTRGQRAPPNVARATFLVGRAHIEKLKARANHDAPNQRASSFAVTVAFAWAHLVKSQKEQKEEDETHHLCFLADCRGRPGVEPPVPAAHFGNCVVPVFVSARRSQLVDDLESGVVHAAMGISRAVRGWVESPAGGIATWDRDFRERMETGNMVTVAGATGMGVYGVDFGWGRARRCVWVHIDTAAATTMSVAEAADGGGGVEIGLALDKERMRSFGDSFERSLKLLSLTSSL